MSAASTCERLGWRLERVDTTGSTNADLMGRSESGLVLVAREQTSGRGRLDRSWVSAPGDGLTFSVRLDVPAVVEAWGWISLLAGVATAEAIRAAGGQGVAVKWPNDVVTEQGKLAGILSERDGQAVVIGIGINVAFSGPVPDPNAVSAAQAGANPDSEALLSGVLEHLHRWWDRFVAAAGDALRSGLADAYAQQCVSIGVDVAVTAPDRTLTGHAEGIDDQGRLLVTDGTDLIAVSAGDVTIQR